MDALMVALAAGIGIVVVAIVTIAVMLLRRGGSAESELWSEGSAQLPPELAPYWHRHAPGVNRPLPPPRDTVQLDDMARVALTAWQDADGKLLDNWLHRQDEHLARVARSDDRAATYAEVLHARSATEERSVHEAIDRAPDRPLREHLVAMQQAGVDLLVHAAKGDLGAASTAYTSYLAHRALAEARLAALEPASS
jgi:hypothetical protein